MNKAFDIHCDSRLESPLNEEANRNLQAYRKRMYAVIYEKSRSSGLLELFAKPITLLEAEKCFDTLPSRRRALDLLLKLLCDIGSLRSYFADDGERVFVRAPQEPVYLRNQEVFEELNPATGDMSATHMVVPNAMFAALHDENVTIDFSERYAEFWRSLLEAQFYASGRELAIREICRPGGSVADLACGPGYALRSLSERVGSTGRVMAVELSEYFVSRARASVQGYDNVQVFAGNLDDGLSMVGDESLDGAMVIGAFHFLVKKEGFIAEAARVLKPGGRLVIGNCFTDVDVLDKPYLDLYFHLFPLPLTASEPVHLQRTFEAYGFRQYFSYYAGSFGWFFAEKRVGG